MKIEIDRGGEVPGSSVKYVIERNGIPRYVWVPVEEMHGMLHVDVATIAWHGKAEVGDVILYNNQRLQVESLNPLGVGAEIRPGEEICDFCSSKQIFKRYHCQTFEMPTHVQGKKLETNMIGDWAACEDCTDLIDADRWEELAERSVNTCRAVNITDRTRPQVLAAIRELHKKFRALRLETN